MKTTERILVSLFFIGVILLFTTIPGRAITLFLPGFLVSIIYFNFGFILFNEIPLKGLFKKENYENISGGQMVIAVVTGIGLSFAIIGVLFKLQHLPGASMMLFVGVFLSMVSTLLSIVNKGKLQQGFIKRVLQRIVLFGGMSLVLLMIPAKTWIEWEYQDHPELKAVLIQLQDDPGNAFLLKKEQELRDKIYKEATGMAPENK